jgi:putative nucleotidyltransferase with HDIG domain
MKLYMGTVPLLTMAITLTPVVASTTAASAWFVGESLARKHTGAWYSDMFTNAARYSLVVFATSAVVHAGFPPDLAFRLLGGVLVYWLLEAITTAVVVCPIGRESPSQVILDFMRSAGTAEGSQYALGILGGLIVDRYPWALVLLVIPVALTYRAFKSAKEMHETTLQMLESMADAVDLRDTDTGGHSRRVAEHTSQILRKLNKAGPEMDLVVSAARVHDIGKIGLPDSVLLKEGKLSEEETVLMQSHPEAGAQLLRRYSEFSRGIDIVRHHHERWDGIGYPRGLKGLAIPFGARIVAVADSFDAMTSDRPYRKGLSIEAARNILLAGRGTQWDPDVVDAFLAVLDERVPVAVLKSSATAVEGADSGRPSMRPGVLPSPS